MQKRQTLKLITAAALMGLAGLAQAQQTIKIANIVELSGPGTTAGTLFKNGVELAIKEINSSGGILGKKIESYSVDTQTNPGIAKGLTQKAVDEGAFAIFGPVYSGSIMVSMAESKRGEVPNFTGGEAASITQQGNPYVFRTAFGQNISYPKLAKFITGKYKSLAIIYANNDFGKGGRDTMMKLLDGSATKVVADISTDAGAVDFSAAVLKAKQSDADAVFVVTNEEESARLLREARKQGVKQPLLGETTLIGQKVIELAGDAANGAVGHVGLTTEAAPLKAFGAKYRAEYKSESDHNGIKGYTGVYVLKAAIEKVGKLDQKAVAAAIRGGCFSTKQTPGLLLDVCFDDKGDLDRESFMVEVKGGHQVVTATLPPLSAKK